MKTRPLIFAGLAVVAIALFVADRTIWTRVHTRGKNIWRPAVAADSVPITVAQAEEQGARYLRPTEPENYSPAYTANTYVGTSERRCVDADTANWVRSGDFISGSFARYTEFWHTQQWGKLLWVTGHRIPLKTPVQFTARVTRIDTTSYAFVYKSATRSIRWRDPYAEDWLGTATWIVLPTRGRWMFVVTMDKAWGCVLFTL